MELRTDDGGAAVTNPDTGLIMGRREMRVLFVGEVLALVDERRTDAAVFVAIASVGCLLCRVLFLVRHEAFIYL